MSMILKNVFGAGNMLACVLSAAVVHAQEARGNINGVVNNSVMRCFTFNTRLSF